MLAGARVRKKGRVLELEGEKKAVSTLDSMDGVAVSGLHQRM